MSNDAWKKCQITLVFNGEDLQTLIDTLGHIPYHLSARWIAEINQQASHQFIKFQEKMAHEESKSKEEVL